MKGITMVSAIAIALLGGGLASAKESAEGGADSRFVTATSAISEVDVSEMLKLALRDEVFTNLLQDAEILGWKADFSMIKGELLSGNDGSRAVRILVSLSKDGTSGPIGLMFAIEEGAAVSSYMLLHGSDEAFAEFEGLERARAQLGQAPELNWSLCWGWVNWNCGNSPTNHPIGNWSTSWAYSRVRMLSCNAATFVGGVYITQNGLYRRLSGVEGRSDYRGHTVSVYDVVRGTRWRPAVVYRYRSAAGCETYRNGSYAGPKLF